MNPSIEFAYRLRIRTVQSGKMDFADSIISLRWEDASNELMNMGAALRSGVRGEAVAAALGDRHGFLFGLLYGPGGSMDKYFSCADSPIEVLGTNRTSAWRSAQSWRNVERASKRKGQYKLEGANMPFLARFEDLRDPNSVVEVRPDDLERHFGQGVRFHDASIERVDVAPTRQIERLLPWINDRRRSLGGSTLANELSASNFRSGV